MKKFAQIHRFGDCVAMFLSKSETVYMTPKDAQAIAKALNACARDIKNAKYVDGTFKTVEFALQDTGHNGTDYKVKRG